jgi:uridine kinase
VIISAVTPSAARTDLLERVAVEIQAITNVRLVAVDGVDGAGKTVFADELAAALARRGAPVIRASVDSFHNPQEVRYRLGRDSPEGFFRDSYDYQRLTALLLIPLGRSGDGRFRRAVYDIDAELPVDVPEEQAEPGAIVVLDGIFMHRPVLRHHWDYSVFLRVGFEVSIPRCARRTAGISPDPDALSNLRYVEGQRIYFRECDPMAHASIVIDNEDPSAPFVVGQPGASQP